MLAILRFIILLLIGSSAVGAAPLQWSDASFIARNSAEVGVADFNKDGHPDIAIAATQQRWYQGPEFNTFHQIGLSDGGPYAAQVADINKDGWPDFVSSDGQRNAPSGDEAGELYVYLHPGNAADSTDSTKWQRITVYSGNVYHQNDLRIADMDGDGRLDIIERTWSPNERVVVAMQNANISTWTVRVFSTGESGKPEGISAGDIDGDDEQEIVLSGVYWDNPGGWRTGSPSEYLIDSEFQGNSRGKVKSAVGDIDNDGDNDVYMADAEGRLSDSFIAWYENTGTAANGGVQFIRHKIKDNFGNCHMVQLVDIDRDGDLDVATGRSFGSNGLYVFYNQMNETGSVSWVEQNYDTGGEIYTGVVADLDGDTDLDVVGPSRFYGGNVRYYINNTPLDPPEPILLTPDSLSFPQLGGSKLVAITTLSDWQLNNLPGWLNASAVSGNGNDEVTLSAVEFTGFGLRSADLVVSNRNNSETLTVTQQGLVDSEPPSTPQIASVSGIEFDRFELSWSAATDNSGSVAEYLVFLNGIEQAGVAGLSTTLTGLSESTVYQVSVAAKDASGNQSTQSDAVSVTTTERPPSPPPILHWTFDELSGDTVLERVTNQNFNLVDMPADPWVAGKLGNALQFNADNDDNDKLDLQQLNLPADAFTISTWINPADKTNNAEGRILAKATGISENQHYWMLSTVISNNQLVPRVRLRTAGTVTAMLGSSATPIMENQWSHLALTYDGASLRLFLNGSNVASDTVSGRVDQSSIVAAAIGNTPAGDTTGRAFDGLLDDLCVFDLALGQQDIQAIYDEGSGRVCNNFSESTVDTTPPIISEFSAVSTPTMNRQPSFVLQSSEPGRAEFAGDCSTTSDKSISAGNNALVLAELNFGVISDCRVSVFDLAGNESAVLTLRAFEILAPDTTPPSVIVNQAADQADPSNSNLARFTIEFSEPVNLATFSRTDLQVSGTSGEITSGPMVLPSSNSRLFSVVLTGMTSGDVATLSLPPMVVADLAGNLNLGSTSIDNSVAYVCEDCAIDDGDNDGVADAEDNCPELANPAQTDSNGNGIGDNCENDSLCFPIAMADSGVTLICL